jgi:hypothetical protein
MANVARSLSLRNITGLSGLQKTESMVRAFIE